MAERSAVGIVDRIAFDHKFKQIFPRLMMWTECGPRHRADDNTVDHGRSKRVELQFIRENRECDQINRSFAAAYLIPVSDAIPAAQAVDSNRKSTKSMPRGHQPVRIAFVVTRFAAGGLERCVAHLVNRLPATEFAPEIVSFGDLASAPNWVTRDAVVPVSMHKQTGNDFRLILRLARWLRENDIAIAHSHNWGTLVETSLACRLAGVIHVHAEHSQQDRLGTATTGWRREAQAKLRRFAFRNCGAVVACADTVRQGIESQWNFPATGVTTVANGVQHPTRGIETDIRKSLGIADSAFLVGSVGRLETLKGFDTLIGAVKNMTGSGVDAHAIIVGDGPQLQPLSALAIQFGVEHRIHLVGYHAHIGDWMSPMDVYVNCSHTEAMSMSILEAMSCGLPVVATDVGDSSILLQAHKTCGIIVPSRNPVALSEALTCYAYDQPLQIRHGKLAAEVYNRHYTLDRMIQAYRELYLSLLPNVDGEVDENVGRSEIPE